MTSVERHTLKKLNKERNKTNNSKKQKHLAQAGCFCYNKVMKRVGILRGGAGEHYESSLKRGGDIILHIHENLSDKYKTSDILIDKNGMWYLNGTPITPADLIHKVDVVWNTAHHNASAILADLSLPHIKNNSIFENSKEMLREHMKQIGVVMPRAVILPLYQRDFDGPRDKYAIKKAKEVFEKFSSPWLVKSLTSDENMGIHLAKTFPELMDAIEDGVKHKTSILVEEFILGKVASVHSVSNFRGEDIYAFPPDNVFGIFSSAEKEALINLARDVHRHIGVDHYLKSNFIMNKRGKIYLSYIESTPNLQAGSHFHQVCTLVGAKTHDIIHHILEQAF